MEYVYRFLSGFAVTLMGCMIALLSMRRTIRENANELKKIEDELEEAENNLTEPASYIWVDVDDHRPTHNGECLVEYYFETCPDVRFHSVFDFDIRADRFQHEGFHGLKVGRWAELPR